MDPVVVLVVLVVVVLACLATWIGRGYADAWRARRARLERLLNGYRLDIELAADAPGCIGEASAWSRAEDAAEALGMLISMTESAEPMIRAAMGRISRSRS